MKDNAEHMSQRGNAGEESDAVCKAPPPVGPFFNRVDRVVWSQAVIVESWTLSLLLLSGLICLLMRWAYRPDQTGYLYAAILVYGLSLGTNQAFAVLWLGLEILIALAKPELGRDACLLTALLAGIMRLTGVVEGVPLMVWDTLLLISATVGIGIAVKTRAVLTCWKPLMLGGFCLLLALSAYLYLPIASMTNPPVNWAYARTPEGCAHLISRGQYERMQPVQSLHRLGEAVWFYGESAVSDFGFLYLVPVLVSLWFLRKMAVRDRAWLLGLLGLWFCSSILLVALLNPAPGRASQDLARLYFSPSHLLLALWAGYGLVLLGTIIARPKRTKCQGAL